MLRDTNGKREMVTQQLVLIIRARCWVSVSCLVVLVVLFGKTRTQHQWTTRILQVGVCLWVWVCLFFVGLGKGGLEGLWRPLAWALLPQVRQGVSQGSPISIERGPGGVYGWWVRSFVPLAFLGEVSVHKFPIYFGVFPI